MFAMGFTRQVWLQFKLPHSCGYGGGYQTAEGMGWGYDTVFGGVNQKVVSMVWVTRQLSICWGL